MAVIDGVEVGPVDFVEISLGCTEHDAPICTLVRVKSSGVLIHLPGEEIRFTNEGHTKEEHRYGSAG